MCYLWSLENTLDGGDSPSRNRITVSECGLRGYFHGTGAGRGAKLHETYHVESSPVERGSVISFDNASPNTWQEEVDAFRLQASWSYDRYDRYGKGSPNSVEQNFEVCSSGRGSIRGSENGRSC